MHKPTVVRFMFGGFLVLCGVWKILSVLLSEPGDVYLFGSSVLATIGILTVSGLLVVAGMLMTFDEVDQGRQIFLAATLIGVIVGLFQEIRVFGEPAPQSVAERLPGIAIAVIFAVYCYRRLGQICVEKNGE